MTRQPTGPRSDEAPIDADDIRRTRQLQRRQWTLEKIGEELGIETHDLDLALWRWLGKRA